ncbi:MAG: response regulator [Pirellulaceae bacterium]
MNVLEKRILLIDDEPLITRTLHAYLTAAGFVYVEILNDPLQVPAKIAEFDPDILLLDISMPEVDGLKILERLGDRVVDDDLTVIMVTSMEADYVKRKALILGACDFISKPVDPDELVRRVNDALSGRPNHDFILNTLAPRSDEV